MNCILINRQSSLRNFTVLIAICLGSVNMTSSAQLQNSERFKKASNKIEKGITQNDKDTLAQGYFELGNNFYQKGEMVKSEAYYQKSKTLYEQLTNPRGIAKASRALAKVQEELNKKQAAIRNYYVAQRNNIKTGDSNSGILNRNDITRLSKPVSKKVQQEILAENINVGMINKDTVEIVENYSRMADIELKEDVTDTAVAAYRNAYRFSRSNPEQALKYNQLITDVYVKEKNFTKAIETKKEVLAEAFVQNSSQRKSREITSLADIYIQQDNDSTAIRLLNESYAIAVKYGHTLEAKKCVEKLDSIFQSDGKKEKSLALYKGFLDQLPGIIVKDSSLADNKIMEETEEKLKQLEIDKALKDELIKKKNVLNYWLGGSIIIMLVFIGVILAILKKLKTKNKKIALQSLRREMNPHFIFNSLNSINQFISNNNELEANQYLAKFSTLMRSVMENSKEDFVLLSKEIELLHNYLDLEKSRFPEKFNFSIDVDSSIYPGEQMYIPGMLIQPHLENAIWHGLRYSDEQGFLKLAFVKKGKLIDITIDDNGIGLSESKKNKTANQQKHNGRGVANTMERISILNELYHQNITCTLADKQPPAHGVIVTLNVPLLKNL